MDLWFIKYSRIHNFQLPDLQKKFELEMEVIFEWTDLKSLSSLVPSKVLGGIEMCRCGELHMHFVGTRQQNKT